MTVADRAPTRGADPANLADRERREVVVEHESLSPVEHHLVNDLRVAAGGPERDNSEALGLAAGE